MFTAPVNYTTMADDSSGLSKKKPTGCLYNSLATLFLISKIIFLEIFVIMFLCVFTPLPWKLLRFALDAQYGSSNSVVATTKDDDTIFHTFSYEFRSGRGIDGEHVDESASTPAAATNDTQPENISSLNRYLDYLRTTAIYVTWPKMLTFEKAWSRTNYFSPATRCRYYALERHANALPFSTKQQQDWLLSREKNDDVAEKSVMLFVHGGALISGSPLKRNSYNWISTIAHYSACTRLLLPTYSLAPEYSAPQALLDLLNVLFDYDRRENGIHYIYGIGFSAGSFLLLQLYITLCCWSLNRNATPFDGVSSSRISDFTVERNDRLLQSFQSLHFCSGLFRTDRLFLNDRVDVSSVLTEFMHVYSAKPKSQDPLLAVVRFLRTHNNISTPMPLIRFFDVDVNSLSNHSLQAYSIFLAAANDNYSLSSNTYLHLFDRKHFKLDPWLLTHGNLKHKFLQNVQSVQYEDENEYLVINAMHHHFFPFMPCTEAGRFVMLTIVADTLK